MKEDKDYLRLIKLRRQPKDEGTVISHMQFNEITDDLNKEAIEHWKHVSDGDK